MTKATADRPAGHPEAAALPSAAGTAPVDSPSAAGPVIVGPPPAVGPAPGGGRVPGSRRAMAGLAAGHAVAVAVLLAASAGFTVPTVAAYGGVALIVMVPQAFTRPRGFEVACGVAAALVLGSGLLLAFGGGPLFWPAALPLIVAVSPIATTRPPRSLLVTAAVLTVPWAVIGIIAWS